MRNRKKPSTQECYEARARRKRNLSSRDVTKHAYSRLGDTGGARALTDFHIYTANSCTRASASYEAALRQTLARLIQFIFTEQTCKTTHNTRGEYVKNYIYVNDFTVMTGETVPSGREKCRL